LFTKAQSSDCAFFSGRGDVEKTTKCCNIINYFEYREIAASSAHTTIFDELVSC
jgi:hypothetical protein